MYGLYDDDVRRTCSPITDTMCVKYKKKKLLLFWACKSRAVTHIKVRDIISKIFSAVDNQQAWKSDSIVHTRHFAMSLNMHLECGNKNREFCRTCWHIHTNHKCRLQWHQWHYITILGGSHKKMLHLQNMIAILILFLKIFQSMLFHVLKAKATRVFLE